MENWKFRICFSGLTAFVLRPNRSGARVVLMNALNEPQQRHKPELRFDKETVKASPWGVPGPPEEELSENGSVWNLKHVDLHFLPAPHVNLTEGFRVATPDSPPSNRGQEPTGQEKEAFYWVPSLERISPESGSINTICLNDPPHQNLKDLVAVRVPLRHGKLFTTKLAFESVDNIVECRFAPKSNSKNSLHNQHCAVEVTFEFTVPQGALTLVGVPFNGEKSTGLAFEPSSDNTVTVSLENSPVDSEQGTLVEGDEIDDDFSLYYRLSQNTLTSEHILPVYKPAEDGRVEGGNCIETRFADNADA